jgi:DNA-binding transcriptional regulator/RsmH inhibitor MraZ
MDAAPASTQRLLMGNEFSSLDEKGRLSLSRRKRDALMPEFVMGLDEGGRLIAARPEIISTWAAIADSMPPESDLRDLFLELVFGSLHDGLAFDNQGRVTIPLALRQAVGLEREVAVLGRMDRLVIMSRADYDSFRNFLSVYHGDERAEAYRSVMQQVRARQSQEPGA